MQIKVCTKNTAQHMQNIENHMQLTNKVCDLKSSNACAVYNVIVIDCFALDSSRIADGNGSDSGKADRIPDESERMKKEGVKRNEPPIRCCQWK